MTPRSPDPLDPFLGEPVDDELYVWAQWAGTGFLIACARDWMRVAADESLLVGVREYARQRAEAIRAELRPA